jgi:uncharacterized membrane protein
MTLLILGIAIWSAAHLLPALAAGQRNELVARIGEPRYKLVFTIVILTSLGLMITGWKEADYVTVYQAATSLRVVTLLLMLISMLLFVVSATKNNLRRRLRHPQMIAVIIWSVAHLLSNGDAASLVLFGGLGVWAAIEIIVINRRDGQWQKPGQQPRKNDITTIAVGLAAFVALLLLHPWISGVNLIQVSAGLTG